MAHSLAKLLYHTVFSTKERHPWLGDEARPRLFAYVGGLVRKEGGIALLVNGASDHVHLLTRLRQDKAVSDVIRAVKALSSGWMHRTFPALAGFAWQTGYGCFTVSHSLVPRVREYIQNQESHHRTTTYKEELLALLRANEMEFDEELLWD